ncbi:MAG: radical SAM protein [Bacilli bacterium]|nr:radical SAM protein [Bacilli bacterium]
MKNRFRHIYLEITNICNLSCPFCSIDNREKKYLDVEKFKKVAMMCKEYTDCLYLHVKGEPLMHPNFFQILDYLESINMNVKITTNGDFLPKYQDLLVKYDNILRINVSLQSLITKTKEDVLKYLENLVVFLNKMSESGKTSVSLRLWNDKKDSLSLEYNEYIKNYLKEYYNSEFIDSKALIPHIYASIEDEFTWPSGCLEVNEQVTRCLGGTTHIGILVNGDVILCCLDSGGFSSFGNVFDKSLHDIIESQKFNQVVTNLKNGKCDLEICKKCTYRNRFSK